MILDLMEERMTGGNAFDVPDRRTARAPDVVSEYRPRCLLCFEKRRWGLVISLFDTRACVFERTKVGEGETFFFFSLVPSRVLFVLCVVGVVPVFMSPRVMMMWMYNQSGISIVSCLFSLAPPMFFLL